MMSVITRPNYISNILDDGYINTSVITTKVFAYTNDLLVPQTLTLGATSNLNIETAKDINLYMGTSNSYTLYTSLYDSNTDVRTDTEVLQVQSESLSNLVVISTPSNISIMPADLSNSYINLGNLYLSQSTDAVQIFDTNLSYFNMSKSLQIAGSLSVADNIISSGSLFGRDMNVWADRSNDSLQRIGYGLRVNDKDELEMVKYAKFDGKDVLKKIAVFGYGRLTSNDSSDSSSNYLVFNSLGEVGVASSNGLSPIANVGGPGISGSNSLLTGTTSFIGNVIPRSNVAYDLGSNDLFWKNIYTSNLVVPSAFNVNGAPFIINSTSSSSTSNAPSCAALSNTYGYMTTLVSSQWTTQNANVYYSTNFSSNGMSSATASNIGIGYSNPSYKLAVNGDIFASDDITAFSDIRLKDNLVPIPDALSKLSSISGYTFTRKDRDGNKRYAGLVAQELQAILPEVVSTDNEGFMSVAYGNVVSLLVEAIKELKGQVNELQSKMV